MIGDILNLVGSGLGLVESLDRNEQAQDLINRGADTSDITAQQLGISRDLFNLLFGNIPATQADLQQLDTGFIQPGIARFEPQYNTAVTRFSEGDRFSPSTLRALLQSRAREGVDDAFDKVTNATTMQALRTGTNAAETLRELAKERAKQTSSALRDAEIAAIGGSEQMNLARQQAGTQGLAATQSPLLDMLKLRGGTASQMFTGNQQLRDTATRGMFNNIQGGFGSQAAARSGVTKIGGEMLQEQPYTSALMLGGRALDRLFQPSSPRPSIGTNFPTGNSGELMY